METKPFVASVLLAATSFLTGCGQTEADCVNGEKPDGTPCYQSTGSSVHSTVQGVSSGRPSDLSKSSNAVISESGKTVGGFGDAHAGVAGEGGVGG